MDLFIFLLTIYTYTLRIPYHPIYSTSELFFCAKVEEIIMENFARRPVAIKFILNEKK